jgi:2-polyprenyl-6-hydroxyphenyl methylase/3-demethylubiquinone-9 3-methyltransferase
MTGVGIGTVVRHRLGRFERVASDAYRSWFVDLAALASTLASLGPARRIVEVGCGEGALAEHLLAVFPDATYVGVDPSEHVGRSFRGDGRRAVFGRGGAAAAVLDGQEPFDLAVVVDVLHHVPAPERLGIVRDAAELVAPGGLVAVKDWEATPGLANLAATVADRYVTGDRGVSFFDADDLRCLVADGAAPSDPVVEARIPPRRNNLLIVRRRR